MTEQYKIDILKKSKIVTDEQFTFFNDYYVVRAGYTHKETLREALEVYEQRKWVKFDVDDKSTYPQRSGHYISFDGRYVSHRYWNNTGQDKRGTNQSWFVSESVNAQKVTHWQPLPEFKE